MSKNIEKINKNLIFLKATTIGLGIVLVTLAFALVIIKSRHKTSHQSSDQCETSSVVTIGSAVNKIELEDNKIIILTDINKKTEQQEIITLDKQCGTVINRITLKINN